MLSSLWLVAAIAPAIILIFRQDDKISDFCRLVPQVISLLKNAWEKAGLDLYLAPYGVLPTSYECGIVEVVPNCDSRSALGDTSDGGLAEIWRREFGAPGTARHEQARLNFIRSEAGCALTLSTLFMDDTAWNCSCSICACLAGGASWRAGLGYSQR